jgi:hypothetical protein
MYWITENEKGVVYKDDYENQRFQDICVNRPSAPLHEDDDIMAPKLPKEHQLDDNRKFLISLLKKHKSSISVIIVVY